MSGCDANCNPKQVGKWYDLVIEYLDTTSFAIRPTSNSGTSRPVYDVRLRSEHSSDPTQLSNPSLTQFRLRAEQKLHQIYVKVAQQRYPHARITEYPPSLFVSFRLSGNQWEWFCEADTLRLGLCHLNPVPLLSVLLTDSISTGKKIFKGSCLIPIHLNLTLDTGELNQQTHAMTVIVNTKCQTIWLFDPMGNPSFSTFPAGNGLDATVTQLLKRVSNHINYTFKGYLTPNCNFQTDNPIFCYLWTTWVELLAVLNPWLTPKSLAKYLQHRYRDLHRQGTKRSTALQFGHYLREIDLYHS
jgi:hypothetical protein